MPYTPLEMFALVDDVAAYHQFLPWCSASSRQQVSVDEVLASVTISKGALRKTFATRNRLQPGKMIEMSLLDGPFRHLHGFWRFDALNSAQGVVQGCRISLDLEFQFTNKLVEFAVGPVFTTVASEMVRAFQKRAEQVYGRRSIG